VQVPLKYPTALTYVDESAVKASAGRFFVVGAVKARKPGLVMRLSATSEIVTISGMNSSSARSVERSSRSSAGVIDRGAA
jgi:hypothetical protein